MATTLQMRKPDDVTRAASFYLEQLERWRAEHSVDEHFLAALGGVKELLGAKEYKRAADYITEHGLRQSMFGDFPRGLHLDYVRALYPEGCWDIWLAYDQPQATHTKPGEFEAGEFEAARGNFVAAHHQRRHPKLEDLRILSHVDKPLDKEALEIFKKSSAYGNIDVSDPRLLTWKTAVAIIRFEQRADRSDLIFERECDPDCYEDEFGELRWVCRDLFQEGMTRDQVLFCIERLAVCEGVQ